MSQTPGSTPWIKATASDSNGSCVEQRRHRGVIEVRDTKDRGAGPVLTAGIAAFAALLDGARAGELDHLA